MEGICSNCKSSIRPDAKSAEVTTNFVAILIEQYALQKLTSYNQVAFLIIEVGAKAGSGRYSKNWVTFVRRGGAHHCKPVCPHDFANIDLGSVNCIGTLQRFYYV